MSASTPDVTQGSVDGARPTNPTPTGFIRPVDFSVLPTDKFFSRFLHFSHEMIFVLSGNASGLPGPAAHFHNVMDQFFYLIEGELEVTVGTETHQLQPGAFVYIPAGTPHKHRNTGSGRELHLEVMAPGHSLGSTFLTFMGPDDVWEPGGSVVHAPPFDEWTQASEGVKMHVLSEPSGTMKPALRDSENLAWWILRMEPGHGLSSGLHYHKFHQFYYVTEGTLGVDIGLESFEVKRHTLVVLPPGAVHRNYAVGSEIESHIQINIPPPTKGPSEQDWAIPVSFGPAED